jgi:hypothetical protein
LPLLTLVALVGAALVLVVAAVRRRGKAFAGMGIPLVPVALQALVIPIGIVASGSVLYDGIRHLLFMFPALLALPAVALVVLERDRLRPRVATAVAVGAVVVVAASLFAAVQWAPYAYAYLNPVAGHDKSAMSWELDYWGVSAREGVTRMHELGYGLVEVRPALAPGRPWGATDSLTHRGPGTGVYVFLREHVDAASLQCSVVFRIKRGGHVLGEGARCPALEASSGTP